MPIALAPLIPAIIGAGASVGTSLINKSGRSGSSSSSLLPPGLDTNALSGLIGQQKDLAGFLTGEGKSMLTEGKGTLNQPMDFYQSLLGGDRTKLMESLAPEIAAINAQFRQPLKEATLTGRGSSLVPDLEGGRQSAISNLIFSGRPQAADKLTSIAQGLMSLGTQQVGMGGNVLGQAAGEVLDYNSLIRGIQAQTRNDSANMLGSLGSSFGPLLADILRGVFDKSGSGGSSTMGTPDLSPAGDAVDPSVLAGLLTSMGGAPEIKASWLGGKG
jgi:hypothetical protein